MRGVPSGQEKKWTPLTIERALREATAVIGSFPTASELRSMGMNDLTCAATKTGGLIFWSEKLGLPRKHSDSDTGWEGELKLMDILRFNGHSPERLKGVKNPYDLIVDGVLRVDVKAARYAVYGRSRGWFFRLGKYVQADLVVLLKLDTNDIYPIPWWECPTGNITLGGDESYAQYRNNWPLIRQMIGMRLAERAQLGMKVAEVA